MSSARPTDSTLHRPPWAPDSVKQHYRAVLTGLRGAPLGEAELTSHWPLVGTADRRLLVVGQAVFGWIPRWTMDQLNTASGIERVIEESAAVFYDREDPMEWIVGNRARSSPFWRVVRRLVEARYADSHANWYSHIAWANIYPVARNDERGNPDGPLRTLQIRPAARLLDAVASELRPEAVIVLGGTYWWDVQELLTLHDQQACERPLLSVGHRHGTRWIAGMHPGGAQRRGWSTDRYAGVLVQALDG